MSQYLIIFLIVAVFRGVVWVVQKVQQNAKAREAMMPQQANAPVAAPAPVSAPRTPQRGQVRKTGRGASKAGRGGAGARASNRSLGLAVTQKTQGPPASTWATSAPSRSDQGARHGPAPRPTSPTGAPASRADLREARVGQSSRDVRKLLLDRSSLRQALLAREILGPPRGLST